MKYEGNFDISLVKLVSCTHKQIYSHKLSLGCGYMMLTCVDACIQAWSEQNRSGAPKKQPDFIAKLKKKHKRAKLHSTITIDSIYEKKFLSLSSVIEAVVLDAFILPGMLLIY